MAGRRVIRDEAVSELVGRLQDDRDDPALAQLGADRTGGVGLVAVQPIRSGARTPDRTGHSQLLEQRQ